jgi:hypothetical protein
MVQSVTCAVKITDAREGRGKFSCSQSWNSVLLFVSDGVDLALRIVSSEAGFGDASERVCCVSDWFGEVPTGLEVVVVRGRGESNPSHCGATLPAWGCSACSCPRWNDGWGRCRDGDVFYTIMPNIGAAGASSQLQRRRVPPVTSTSCSAITCCFLFFLASR